MAAVSTSTDKVHHVTREDEASLDKRQTTCGLNLFGTGGRMSNYDIKPEGTKITCKKCLRFMERGVYHSLGFSNVR